MINKLIPLLCLIFISCGQSRSTGKTKVNEYFIKGDPLSIIQGAQKNTSFLTPAEFEKLAGFNFYPEKMTSFIKIGTKTKKSSSEEGQEPTEDYEEEEIEYSYQLVPSSDKTYTFMDFNNPKKGIKLTFSLSEQGKLRLDKFSVDGNDFPVTGLHYSVKNDQSAFSILFLYKSESQEQLLSTTFVKKFDQGFERGEKIYNYLLGKGVKMKWLNPQDINVSICGENASLLEPSIQASINAWNEKTSVIQVNLSKRIKNFPPYSDLNSQCFYMIKEYIYAQEDFPVGGIALPNFNPTRGEILDADIFVFKEEWKKVHRNVSDSENYVQLTETLTHEVGHLLGLDHQFNGTASIMAYSGDDDEISAYDLEAIEELYR